MYGDWLVADGRLREDLDKRIVPDKGRIRFGDKLLPRVERRRPDPPARQFAGLIGEYGGDHDILYVLEKNGKLQVLIEWFEYDPLEQVSDNVFKFPDHGLYDGESATLALDAAGQATQVKIGEVVFKRRKASGSNELQVHPTESITALRQRAMAAKPPEQSGSLRAPDLVDLT